MERTERRGPVFARSEVVITASARRVWAVLAQIDEWPTWNPGMRRASLDGALDVRTSLRWDAGPGTNTGTLTEVDAPRILAWQGRAMGIRHERSWRLAEHPLGCHVTTEQSMSGLVARLLPGRLQQWLQRELDTWLQLLKLEAEARARADETTAGQEGSPMMARHTVVSTGRVS